VHEHGDPIARSVQLAELGRMVPVPMQ
jgi:hypothetical protein